MDLALTIAIEPQWERIEGVREASMAFLRARGLDDDVVHAVSMVAAELTSNAVAHGAYDGPDARIAVSVALARDAITVQVRSPVSAREEDLTRLDRTIQWIRGYQDPYEAYLARLRDVSSRSVDAKESGLGLVRIAYEGQSVVDFFVDDENVVSISAVHTLDRPAEGTR